MKWVFVVGRILYVMSFSSQGVDTRLGRGFHCNGSDGECPLNHRPSSDVVSHSFNVDGLRH